MHVTISARHGHLSAASQQRIEEKVEKLRRFFDRISSIAVTIDLEDENAPHVEVRVSAEHHPGDFLASDSSSSVSAALDSVIHKIGPQRRKHKEKLTGHRSPGLKHMPTDQEDSAD